MRCTVVIKPELRRRIYWTNVSIDTFALVGRPLLLNPLGADVGKPIPKQWTLMVLVVSGLLNKQVGGELGISEITVKAHRGKVMQKMKADSFADLVKMAARLGLAPATRA
jgi:DNA-binding CsgD family transcriptional regulator